MHLPALPKSLPAFPKSLPPFPRPLARVIATLPSWPASRAFAAAANLAAWSALRELDWDVVSGRRFCVRVRDLGLRFHFTVRPTGFRALRHGPAEVTFTASAQDFARLALRLEDPDTLFFNRRLLIEGDTDLGLTVKNMLDALELETAAAALPAGLGRVVMKLRALAMG